MFGLTRLLQVLNITYAEFNHSSLNNNPLTIPNVTSTIDFNDFNRPFASITSEQNIVHAHRKRTVQNEPYKIDATWILAAFHSLQTPCVHPVEHYTKTSLLSLQAYFLTESPLLVYSCSKQTARIKTSYHREVNNTEHHSDSVVQKTFQTNDLTHHQCVDMITSGLSPDNRMLKPVHWSSPHMFDGISLMPDYYISPPLTTWRDPVNRTKAAYAKYKQQCSSFVTYQTYIDYTIQKIPLVLEQATQQILAIPAFLTNTDCKITDLTCPTDRGHIVLNYPTNYNYSAVHPQIRHDNCKISSEHILCPSLNLMITDVKSRPPCTSLRGILQMKFSDEIIFLEPDNIYGDINFQPFLQNLPIGSTKTIQAFHVVN